MTRATLTIAVAFLWSTAGATPPPVTVVSPCECLDAHGKARLGVKNDRQLRLRSFDCGRFERATAGAELADLHDQLVPNETKTMSTFISKRRGSEDLINKALP